MPRHQPRLSLEEVALALFGVAAATAAVELLRHLTPAPGLGVIYLIPVLLVALRSGVPLALATATLSMLAFNFFEIEPRYRLTITDDNNWVVVGVVLAVSVVAARIAAAARQATRRERQQRLRADTLAELSRHILGSNELEGQLPSINSEVSGFIGQNAAVELPDEDGFELVFATAPTAQALELAESIREPLEGLIRARQHRDRLANASAEAEAMRRSDEIKTTIIRSVSHDLRTPLTQIAASAAALRSPAALAEERDELAVSIEQGAQRLSQTVSKLLELSRIDGGLANPAREIVPLDDLVRDAIDRIPGAVGRVKLEIQTPTPSVDVDPTQVLSALVNLIDNAFIHGGNNDVLIRVAIRQQQAMVRIVDRGPGMTAEVLEQIFQPFQKGPNGSGSGSGLGLAIARGFIEANDGSLHAESYPGQGATFVIKLPLSQSPTDPAEGTDR